MKKVIIVSYTFPPVSGIGGRRWVKFAKYFNRSKEVDLRVVHARIQSKKESHWTRDAQTIDSSKRVNIPSGFPEILNSVPEGIWNKLKYRLALLRLRLTKKGNYYDRAGFWGKAIVNQVEAFIIQGFNNVLVTVGPFHHCHELLSLKAKYPEVNFVLDFRDPWTNNLTSFGFDQLPKKRFQHELKLEREAINGYDKVVTTSRMMHPHFKSFCKEDKFYEISNGYDPEDHPVIEPYKKEKREKIKLVMIGTFYDKAEVFLKALSELLMNEKKFHNFEFSFYGPMKREIQGYCTTEQIIHHKSIPFDEAQKVLAQSDLGMLFLTDDMNYNFSTKFYEYIAHRKPICIFAKPGITAEYIEENNIGYAVELRNMEQTLSRIQHDFEEGKIMFNEAFDTNQFSVKVLAENYLQLFQ